MKAIASLADDVEIRHRRLHHDHVRAFLNIEFDFAHRFARVGRIHLIAAPVAELRRGFRGFAERSVENRSVLRGVRNDGSICESRRIQRLADRGHAPVHHVAGCNDIGARARMRHRCFRQPLECGVVLHLAIHNQSAVAVAGVFAIADIRHD